MVIEKDGTLVAESKEDLRNLLNSDHQGMVFSVTTEDATVEGSDELPLPKEVATVSTHCISLYLRDCGN